MFGEHLKSLNLSVLTLLHRIPYEIELLESPCYRCGKYLSDIDGLPLNASGWIPPAPARSGAEKANGKADEGMDVDGEDKKEDKEDDKKDKNDEKDEDKEAKDAEKEGEEDGEAKEKAEAKEENKDGRWVKWHASCRVP